MNHNRSTDQHLLFLAKYIKYDVTDKFTPRAIRILTAD